MLLDAVCQMRLIVDIAFDDGSPFHKTPMSRLKIIKADRSIAGAGKSFATMGPDITGAARHENAILISHFAYPARPSANPRTTKSCFGTASRTGLLAGAVNLPAYAK